MYTPMLPVIRNIRGRLKLALNDRRRDNLINTPIMLTISIILIRDWIQHSCD
jgi:hypothetical protein